MKRKLLIILSILCCNIINAQHGNDSFYDSLSFTNGICQKNIIVIYNSFGKNPLGSDSDSEVFKIKKELKYIPHSSISFFYKEKQYYISVANNCKLPAFNKGDTLQLSIKFFENIKQPYKYKHPFSIITSLKKI